MESYHEELSTKLGTDEIPAAMPTPPEVPQPRANEDVFVIPRTTFNYAIIAVTFLLVGIVIGALLFRTLQTAPINETVLADLVENAVAKVLSVDASTAADTQEGLDVNTYYEVSSDGDPAFGPDDALVTIVEFSDFRCSYCGRFAAETLPALLNDYGDKVRFVYRDYPQFGYLSFQAAMAAECANDQDQFWAYHDLLFANATQITDDIFPLLATQVSLDLEQFTDCMTNQIHRDEIIEDFEDGQQYGPIGTPTFFINGKPVIGAQSYLIFAQAIDQALAEAQANATS